MPRVEINLAHDRLGRPNYNCIELYIDDTRVAVIYGAMSEIVAEAACRYLEKPNRKYGIADRNIFARPRITGGFEIKCWNEIEHPNCTCGNRSNDLQHKDTDLPPEGT